MARRKQASQKAQDEAAARLIQQNAALDAAQKRIAEQKKEQRQHLTESRVAFEQRRLAIIEKQKEEAMARERSIKSFHKKERAIALRQDEFERNKNVSAHRQAHGPARVASPRHCCGCCAPLPRPP